MILFTGHGDIANEFSRKYPCEVKSLRKASIAELEKLLPSYKVIVHNAANLNPINIEEATNDNFLLTKNIIDTLVRVNPSAKLIYLSTMSLLQNAEEYLNPLCMTPYALSKYLGEIYTLTCQLSNTIAVRFSTIFYGNPQKDGLSKLLWEAVNLGKITIYNDGAARRDFLPIEVLVDYLFGFCNATTYSKVYTVCSGKSTSFNEIASFLNSRLSDLTVENLKLEEKRPVLHEFSNKELLDFDVTYSELEYYIDHYISSLTEVK